MKDKNHTCDICDIWQQNLDSPIFGPTITEFIII